MSIRQDRKAARKGKDKWGFPMNLSRARRRQLRNQAYNASYTGKGGRNFTLEPGGQVQSDESGLILHGGGSWK